jgi:N utilization substance protein A
MNPTQILQVVDGIHREKNINKEIVFEAVEAGLASALRKHFGEEAAIEVKIDREKGAYTAVADGKDLDSAEAEDLVGRIGAQTAKQVIIQKIREAERDSLFDEYNAEIGQLVNGIVQRYENGTATVALTNTEAILPRSEQIPGETQHVGERVRATVCEVRKAGSRVKVILSRTRTDLVQRLFEQEIPEINDGVIEIHAMAREPGYRTKVAVSSSDPRVDCVGACVGVRGNRIKNVVDELAGERIDIVRWSDDMQILIPNALQPAEVDEVILCQVLGRAIVLVREDQLSLAIGRKGQNVRLGSKLCLWDIEIMTREELDESIERAVGSFSEIEGITEEIAENLVGEGFLSYDDLSIIETDDLIALGVPTAEEAEAIRERAEELALVAEKAENERRERERNDAAKAAQAAALAAASGAAPAAPEQSAAESSVTQPLASDELAPDETMQDDQQSEAVPAEESSGQDLVGPEEPTAESKTETMP